MKSKLKKILFIVLSLVVVLSACILPSFAWSLDEYPSKVEYTSYLGYADAYSSSQSIHFAFEISGVLTNEIRLPNNASNTEVYIQIYSASLGNLFSTTIKAPNETSYMYRVYQSGVSGYMQTYFYFNGDNDRVLYIDYLNIQTPIDDISTLRCRVRFKPSSDYVFNTLGSYINEYENTPEGYRDLIAEKDALIDGLANNNVLDGTFSGIGDGFSSMIAPLLSMSVGGVSLGNVIGVLLIVGVVLLFVFLINKIRGA